MNGQVNLLCVQGCFESYQMDVLFQVKGLNNRYKNRY